MFGVDANKFLYLSRHCVEIIKIDKHDIRDNSKPT